MYSKKEELKVGIWTEIAPDNCPNAFNGSWHGYMKKGTENKVIVCFWGGGVAVDHFSLCHPNEFFTTDITDINSQECGITSSSEANPFRNWTICMLPYSTGDFHAGTQDYKFTDEEGKEKVIHFQGYNNYRKYMDMVVERLDKKPEAVVVTGFSAGGFATGLLANDVITNYFNDVENTVAFVDSGIMIFNNPHGLCADFWHTPKEISDRVTSDDLILDSLKALSKDHPKTKILFTMSTRDAIIGVYQGYSINGDRDPSTECGDQMFRILKQFMNGFQTINNSSAFIWDDKLCGYFPDEFGLTDHTIEFNERFYSTKIGKDQKSISDWLTDCLAGNLTSHGIELLNQD